MAAVFAFLIGVTISFDACKKEDNSISNKSTMTDQRDGKVYKTVALGGKTWMAENLNYDTGNGLWVYDNDPSNANTYGDYMTGLLQIVFVRMAGTYPLIQNGIN